MNKILLAPPEREDLFALLSAWRIWVGGALLGAVLAAIIYFVAPPPFRAQATVLVDQNAEKAIPVEQTDLRKFDFLQRETDKLVLIAWADQTLGVVSAQTGLPVSALRDGRLQLSQPSDGGWHFLADSRDPQTASALAAAWAGAFVQVVQSKPAGINPLLEINYTQQQNLPITRTISMGTYVFAGSLIGIALLALAVLFIHRKDA
ncbi:MAG TPA: hypothetical protein VMC09_12655 [Anaerolineales bacterium]|nr:hypothetical protein [Anaerolineales bacterium]